MNNSNISSYKKNALKGIICILLYIFVEVIAISMLKLFDIDYSTMNIHLKVIYVLLVEIITMSSIMLVLNKKITKDIDDMKKNHKKYFKKYFKYYLIALFIMILSNVIINKIMGDNSIAGNEEALRDIFKVSPLYVYISSVFIAPITEELVFRQSIRNILSNKILFIIISGLVFGTLHVLTGFSSPFDLLYLIPYVAPGITFAYILADSDNICISTSLHFMHNGVLMALQVLSLLFI